MSKLFLLSLALVLPLQVHANLGVTQTPPPKRYVIVEPDVVTVFQTISETEEPLVVDEEKAQELKRRFKGMEILEDTPMQAQLDPKAGQNCPSPATVPTGALPWHVTKVKADKAWTVTRGAGIKVAVIDSGVQTDHPWLKGKILAAYSMIGGSGEDQNGHGTHVAGIVTSIAPEAKIISYKVLDASGWGYASSVTAAVKHAVSQGAHIISMSLGYHQDYGPLKTAIESAKALGIRVVAANGNYGSSANPTVLYPARYASEAVAASTSSDTAASYTSYGPETDLIAPGTSVVSSCLGGTSCTKSGTSMATPVVSGSLALMLAAKKKSVPCARKLANVLETKQGWGLIDAQSCVN